MTEEMEEADKVGDSRKIWECVRRLGGKTASTAGVQPSKYKGTNLRSPEESAAAWREVAKNKFSCTVRERHRSPLPDLGPAEGRRGRIPTDDVLEVCLAALRKSRAPGLDGIPVETYQASPSAKRDLFELVRRVWTDEQVPEAMVMGELIPIFKNKGSRDDFTKYRMIGLIPHAGKLLSAVLLYYLVRETTNYFSESQFGFRSGRSTRDAIYVLTQVINICLEPQTGGLPGRQFNLDHDTNVAAAAGKCDKTTNSGAVGSEKEKRQPQLSLDSWESSDNCGSKRRRAQDKKGGGTTAYSLIRTARKTHKLRTKRKDRRISSGSGRWRCRQQGSDHVHRLCRSIRQHITPVLGRGHRGGRSLRQFKSNLQSNLQTCDISRPGFTTGWWRQGTYRPVSSR